MRLSEALSSAILNPTKINMNMVDSQQARRFIDRIVGFDIQVCYGKNIIQI